MTLLTVSFSIGSACDGRGDGIDGERLQYRLIRDRQWRRPRQRLHPAKPKVGIRASAPNQIWHIDTTLIRLLDGSRAYLHALIDNFSRRILEWKVTPTFDPGATAELLLAARKGLDHGTPTLLADAGPENLSTGGR